MSKIRVNPKLTTMVALVATLAGPSLGAAAICNVPSVLHPDIQAAIDDMGCAPIVVAAGTYQEIVVVDRALSLDGAGSDQTFIRGQIQVSAGTVHLNGLHITGPADALWAHSGGEISGFDLVVIDGAVQGTLIFADGFESGGTSPWSAVSP